MNKIKLSMIIILLLFASTKIISQDYSYSQYNYTPLNINPGIISSEEATSFIFNQRNHEYINNLKFKTLQFSAFYTFPNPKKNNKSIGFLASNDQISTGGLFKHQKVALAFSQSIKITGSSFLSLGIQGGYNQKSINTENYTTGSQWVNNIGFDPSLGSGETFTTENINYFNVNSGVYWYQINEEGQKRAYAGISAFNLNRPDESFLDNASKIPLKLIANTGYTIYRNRNFALTPEVLYINFNNLHFASIGNTFSYSFKNANPHIPVGYGSLNLGTRYLTNQSVSLSLQVVLENFAFGISRDMGINAQENNYPIGGITEFVFAFKKNFSRKQSQRSTEESYEVGQIRDFQVQDFSEDFQADVDEQISYQDTTISYRVELKKDFKFNFNGAELDENAKIYLDDIANLMNSDKFLKLEIIGHTDNVGTKSANQKISKLRAETVANYLIEKGVNKRRLKITAKSDSDPIFPNNTKSNRAKNRRVEFVIYK